MYGSEPPRMLVGREYARRNKKLDLTGYRLVHKIFYFSSKGPLVAHNVDSPGVPLYRENRKKER